LLSLFRTNQAYAGLLLFFYALVLQLPTLLGGGEPRLEEPGEGWLGNWLMMWVGDRQLLALLLPVVLVFLQSLQATALVTRHRMSRSITQFPGLFLILAWALVPAFHWLHPVQVANIFLLFGLLALGRLYKRDEPAIPLFNAGAWLGVASLFCPEYLFFLPAFLIAVGVLRRPDFRSLFQLITGLLLLYFLVGSGIYFFGNLPAAVRLQFSSFGWPTFIETGTISYYTLWFLAVLPPLLFLAYGWLTRLLNIEGSKGVNILYWVLLSSLLLLAFGGLVSASFVQITTVPLGILLGLAFIEIAPKPASFLHLLLLLAALLPGVLQILDAIPG